MATEAGEDVESVAQIHGYPSGMASGGGGSGGGGSGGGAACLNRCHAVELSGVMSR